MRCLQAAFLLSVVETVWGNPVVAKVGGLGDKRLLETDREAQRPFIQPEGDQEGAAWDWNCPALGVWSLNKELSDAAFEDAEGDVWLQVKWIPDGYALRFSYVNDYVVNSWSYHRPCPADVIFTDLWQLTDFPTSDSQEEIEKELRYLLKWAVVSLKLNEEKQLYLERGSRLLVFDPLPPTSSPPP